MVTIKISDYVNHCYTNDDGDTIRELVLKQFHSNQKVVLSFSGIDSVSTSFLNSALIDLLDLYSFEYIKEHLGFANSSKSINDAIRRRFSFEVSKKNELQHV